MAFWKKGLSRIVTPECKLCEFNKIIAPLGLEGYKQETVVGQGNKRVLIVTEPRLIEEVRLGAKYEKSAVGQELRFRAMPYVDIFDDCWIIPATQCPPVKVVNKAIVDDPKPKRVGPCHAWIQKNVEELKPTVLVLIGDIAIRTWYNAIYLENVSAYHLSNRAIPDYKHNMWVVPIVDFEPLYAKPREEGWNNVFNAQFQKAFAYASMPLPPAIDYNAKVKVLTEFEDVARNLQHVLDIKPEWFDHDYETDSLRPQTRNTKLFSASWMYDDDFAYSAPIDGWNHFNPKQQKEIKDLWRGILLDDKIKKAAHNIQMENMWARGYLNAEIGNWGWDTMVGAHMLDDRTGTKSLKFLAFVQYGFGPYNERIKPYLEDTNESTGLNRIAEAPKMDILHYGGLDSLFGRMLRIDQMKAMRYGTPRETPQCKAWREVYNEGTVTMTEMTINGFRVDVEGYNKLEPELRREQKQILDEIQAMEPVKKFFDVYHTPLEVSSNDHLRKLLFNIMGFESGKQTKGGAEAVSADVLEELDIPVCHLVHRWRKIEKVLGTFISGYRKLTGVDGIIHPSYNLHTTRTGRSSSTDPNFGL